MCVCVFFKVRSLSNKTERVTFRSLEQIFIKKKTLIVSFLKCRQLKNIFQFMTQLKIKLACFKVVYAFEKKKKKRKKKSVWYIFYLKF